MTRLTAIAGIVLVGLVGCGDNETAVRVIPAGENDVGIETLSIEEATHGSNRVLMIRGLDDDGEELANATLDIGEIEFQQEINSPIDFVRGADLEMEWLESGHTATFSVPDNFPREVGQPDGDLGVFANLAVAEITAASGLGFKSLRFAPKQGEIAYVNEQACYSGDIPVDMNGGCYQSFDGDGSGNYTTVSLTASNGIIYHRHYINQPCRNGDGSIGCGSGGSGMCQYGPCNGYQFSAQGASNGKIFHSAPYIPNFDGGWDTDGSTSGNGSPLDWNNHPLWGNVADGCPYTFCTADGQPH